MLHDLVPAPVPKARYWEEQDTSRTLSDHQGYTHEDVTGHVSPELQGHSGSSATPLVRIVTLQCGTCCKGGVIYDGLFRHELGGCIRSQTVRDIKHRIYGACSVHPSYQSNIVYKGMRLRVRVWLQCVCVCVFDE